jgi:hypothetical protein
MMPVHGDKKGRNGDVSAFFVVFVYRLQKMGN